jgi:hypothetical protein
MKRYLIQHQTMRANPTAWADTVDEAKSSADTIWGPECTGVRQEISDGETGERWFRSDGRSEWQHGAALRPGPQA